MNMLLRAQILNDIRKRIKNDDEFFYQHRLTGRVFEVRTYSDNSVFVAESLPANGDLRAKIAENPNNSLSILANAEKARLVRSSVRAGHLSIFYGTMELAVDAIVNALDSNRILIDSRSKDSDSFDTQITEARERIYSIEKSISYWLSKTTAGATGSGIFNGTSNADGELSKEARNRILSFINSPSKETWNQCFSITVVDNITLWHLWRINDSLAPLCLEEPGAWPSIPEPHKIIDWISSQSAKTRLEANQKLSDARAELKFAKNELRMLMSRPNHASQSY